MTDEYDFDPYDDASNDEPWVGVTEADAVPHENEEPRRDACGDEHGEAQGEAQPEGQAPASLYPATTGVAMVLDTCPEGEDDGDDNYTLSTAVTYVEEYGLSAFRVTLTDKSPAMQSEALKTVQYERLATVDELCDWFGDAPDQPHCGIGIYAGAVSGNLLIADYDRADIHDTFVQRCVEQGVGHLVERMPHVQTRKGHHRYFRCADYPYSKMKLAAYLNEAGKKCTLIEVQGTGTYAVAPSRLPGMPPAPDCPYRVVSGSLGDIPVFSAEDVDTLLDIMRSLTEVHPNPKLEPTLPPAPGGGSRPGDDYSARGDYHVLLETHGWQYMSTRPDGVEYWRRPGKTEGSCSATYNPALGLFYIFSSNADPFEEGQAYKLFAVYALLAHGGNYSAAAKALREEGYGDPDWGDPDKVWATAEELTAAREAIAQAQSAMTATAIHAVVPSLALLPVGEYADVVQRMKAMVPSLNKRELESAVKKVRKALLAKQQLGREEETPSSLPVLEFSANCPFREKGQTVLRYLEQANTPPTLFRSGTENVELTEDCDGHPVLAELGREGWCNRVANACDIVKASKEGMTHIAPPHEVITYLMGERSNIPFPRIEGIAGTPLVRPDGSIHATPGYDPELRRVLSLPKGFTLRAVSDNPSEAEVREAKALLEEVFCDFTFDPPSCKANLYALRFSPLLEPYFQARTPLALIEAAGQRSGKTLCARAVAVETLGYEVGFMTEPSSDEEWQKQLVATLRGGPALAIIDNVDRPLRAGSLCNMLTSLLWDTRELGHSRNIKLPNHTVWMATGNNIHTGGDMFRRTFSIRLKVQGNEKRTEPFAHFPLLRWVREHWLDITWAKLTLWNAFRAANSTEVWEGPVLESFEEWSDTMGRLLQFLGINGFLADQKERQARADIETGQWEAFYLLLRSYYDEFPFTVRDLLEKHGEDAAFKDALPDVLAEAGNTEYGSRAHRFGQEFRKRDETPYGSDNIRIERYTPKEEQRSNRAVQWVIRSG